ncbi:MAG: amylo-alpha-1,6-glucosidase [Thermoplasmata archaeon]
MSGADPLPRTAPPVLLTSLNAAALLDGRGDLELATEMRGAAVDWGGVIAQCVRLTGPWRVALGSAEAGGTLSETLTGSGRVPGGWTSRHRWNGFEIVQEVAAVGGPPGVVRTFRCERTSGPAVPLTLTSSFAPFLLPVLVEGIRPHSFRVDTTAEELRVRQHGFALTLRSNVMPTRLFLNRGSWLGGRYRGRVDELGVEYTLPVGPGTVPQLRLLVAGGLERELDTFAREAGSVLADPRAAAGAIDAADRTWSAATPALSFPDAPDLERGYGLARAALRRLYSAPGDGLTGLVAGYPWYAALWGRDLAWMLGAVLWLGDFDWAHRSIDTALRFQSHAEMPILGGEPGELAMQVSPGPIFFYGTSDTTLYYPVLIAQFGRHTGASSAPEAWRRGVRRMIAWGERRSDPASGLLRNGGEAEEISTATAGLARVRYGIDSPDTTIWDSTDRRDHAVDIQSLWWRSLRAAADLLRDVPDGSADRWEATAERVAGSLRARYSWPSERYLYDSLRGDRPREQVRPNALRAVSAGLFDRADALRFVRRAAEDDLTTPWGVRTLSSRDPGYDPIAYHDGEVWTIATAWAADAALAAGDAELGVRYLSAIVRRYDAEGGFANECYRGDRPEPFDSCFLLGFSVAPFLTTLFERLWGITMDAPAGRLSARPTFPAAWHSASLERLRVGGGTVALAWTPGRITVRWSGPGTLTVNAGATAVRVAPGATGEVAVAPAT